MLNRRKIGRRPYAATCASALLSSLTIVSSLAIAAQPDELEEIIVTASKRETSLMQTPLAISAFTQDFLDREGVRSVRDLTGTMPNVQLGTGADSGTAATIRGVTSTDFTEVAEGSVAIHFDGFYSPRAQGALALMYDLERVEVLRGPQGTLFGMNSSGGTVNIIPAKPQFDSTFAKVEAALGNYNERQVRGMVNLPISDTFGLRIAAMAESHDGMLTQRKDTTDIAYAANGIAADGIPDVDQRRNRDVSESDWYNNADQWAGRVIARWQPAEWLEAVGTISHFTDKSTGDLDFVDCDQAAGTVNACNHSLRWVNVNVPGKKDLTIDDFQLTLSAAVSDNVKVEYRGSYQDQERYQIEDVDGGTRAAPQWSSIGEPRTAEAEQTGYYPIWDESWETKVSRYETNTHELQIKSTGDSKLQYVGGLYYLKEQKRIRYDMEMLALKTYSVDPDQPLGFVPDGLPDTWVFDQADRTTTSKAVFAQFDYRIVEKVNLTLGYRYTEDEKTDDNGITYAFWGGNADWYNGGHTPDSIRAHQSNDLTTNMGGWPPLDNGPLPKGDPTHNTRSWNSGTYRIGAQYFANDDQMLFASVATGHKAGGMHENFDTCANGCLKLLSYEPETVTSYEVGWKATLLDNHLQLSMTAFLSNYTDMQNTGDKPIGVNTDPTSPNFGDNVNAWYTDNLSKARIKGLETEFDLIPWKSARLFGYVAWLDTEVTDQGLFRDAYACNERIIYGQPECGSSGTQNIVGNQLRFAPEYSLTVNYEHTFDMASGFTIVPLASVHWQSQMWFDVLNYDGPHLSQKQNAFAKLNASIRLNAPAERYYVEFFGENLTDEDTKNFFGFNQGMVKGYYDPPRTFGLRGGWSFE